MAWHQANKQRAGDEQLNIFYIKTCGQGVLQLQIFTRSH